MKKLLIYTFSILILSLSGCSTDKIPGVYRIDIQQGNDVTQDMINQLKPEMTKKQVAYVMGTPLLIDTFHPDRWDYIYSFQPGNGNREQRRLTLFFVDDKLEHIEGDTRTVAREDLPKTERVDSNIEVPLTERKTGLFQSLLNTIGLGNDDEPDIIKTEPKKIETSSQTETDTSATETALP
jgi:outer membrane protein assembly factor BamE